jgi:polar amino acid transport system substrate-binding protein
MKKYIFIAFLFLSFQITAAQLKPINVGWEVWYPYQYQGKSKQLMGVDISIMNAIAEQMSVELVYEELPWKRHLKYIKTGQFDVAMGSSKTEERQAYSYFTQPYRIEEIKLFVLKEKAQTIKLKNLADVINSQYILGVERGYFYGDEYASLSSRAAFKNHFNEVTDLSQNVKMLLKGNIDGLLADPVAMKTYSEFFNLQGKFTQLSLHIYQTEIHLMLSKASMTQADLTRFDKAITVLKNSGEIEKILNNTF